MKVGKPMSKRQPVRLRHKIQKASAAKQRKERKDAKKNPQWVSRMKKDPGIPNLFPFKAKVLAEIEEGRRRKEEEMRQKREIAKAQRNGTAVPGEATVVDDAEDSDEELMDHTAEVDEDDEMDTANDSNPMAALLASAQARAQGFSKDDENDSEDGHLEDDDWEGIEETAPSRKPANKVLSKKILEDPIKAVSALMERMQNTQDGIQRLIDHYEVPALVTTGNEFNSRFLCEVARKRGRLGRGGVPNLHAAALIVMSDLNEERVQLPAPQPKKTSTKGKGKANVEIVSSMAEPFKLEGLWDEKDA